MKNLLSIIGIFLFLISPLKGDEKVKKNLDNYVEIYSLEVKDMKGTSMRIWVPKKCYQKLQLNNLI